MIEGLAFYSLKRDEYYTFGYKVLDVLSGFDTETLQLKPLQGRVENAVSLLDEALVKTSTRILTLSMSESDKNRDNSFLAFRYMIVACSKRLNPAWNAAANLLIDTVKSYGWTLQNENYSTESSRLNNLIADLETKSDLKAAVALLGLNDWLVEMKQSQRDFEMAEKLRVEAKASKCEVKTEDGCREIRKACELLFQYINMTQELNPNEDFVRITRLLNEVIAEFNTSINIRKSRNSKEEETPETFATNE